MEKNTVDLFWEFVKNELAIGKISSREDVKKIREYLTLKRPSELEELTGYRVDRKIVKRCRNFYLNPAPSERTILKILYTCGKVTRVDLRRRYASYGYSPNTFHTVELATLKNLDLYEKWKEGRRVYYRVNTEKMALVWPFLSQNYEIKQSCKAGERTRIKMSLMEAKQKALSLLGCKDVKELAKISVSQIERLKRSELGDPPRGYLAKVKRWLTKKLREVKK